MMKSISSPGLEHYEEEDGALCPLSTLNNILSHIKLIPPLGGGLYHAEVLNPLLLSLSWPGPLMPRPLPPALSLGAHGGPVRQRARD